VEACEHRLVDLEGLHRELVGDGWRLDGETLRSPTGDWWLSAGHLREMAPLHLYGAMARRHEIDADVELAALLRGLAACSEEIRTVLGFYSAAHVVFVRWCIGRGLDFRAWSFSQPSLRASARHPNGGVACVEWLATASTHAELHVYHWVDHVGRERRSWRRLVHEGPVWEDLEQRLDDAVRAFDDSPLVAEDGQISEDEEQLPPLR